MHASTGKSGQYVYLKCNGRNSISNTHCKSPNIRLDLFEPLVLETVIDSVLTTSRVRQILDDCKRNADSLSSSQTKVRQALSDHKAQVEMK